MAGLERAHDLRTVTAEATAQALPEAATGSTRYFVLLYCPSSRRRALATLLALADEIDAGNARSMDHAVAHVRLEWWRAELQRFARRAPEHPWLSRWLREQPQDHALGLEKLIEAAQIDLASARLAARIEHRLAGARFVLIAELLGVEPLSPELERQLRELGAYVGALERGMIDAPPLPFEGAQPRLTPLLVWVALAERKAARRPRSGGRFDMLADNFIAWRAARRAQRGRFLSAR